MAGSLFERLAYGRAGEELDEDESIRRNILRMFTARQGSVQAAPEWGLPDINDLTLSRSELAAQTAGAVREGIELYEPRLTAVDVEAISLPQIPELISLKITAHKRDAEGRISPWEWTVSLDGRKVRRSGEFQEN